MSTLSNAPVAIIGGGLSGLTLGYELHTRGIPFVIYEASDHLGGAARTSQEHSYVVEQGPNGFLNNAPATLDLLRRLGLQSQIVEASGVASTRYVWANERLHPVPTSPLALLRSSLIPLKSKLRLFTEPFRKHQPSKPEESVFDFFSRHFDSELATNVAAPFVIGVFAGDAKLLSIQECFPPLVQTESEFGSLLRGMLKKKKGARTRLISLTHGVGQLLETLVQAIPADSVHLNQAVISIERKASSLHSEFNVTTAASTRTHSAVVFSCNSATLAALASRLLPPELCQAIQKFPVAPVRTLSLSFKGKTGFHGFGTLLRTRPTDSEKPTLLGFLHPPDLFPNRCAEGEDVLTTLWGGHWANASLEMPVQKLTAFAIQELEKILGHSLPQVQKVWDWSHRPGIPQYTVESLGLISRLKKIPETHQGLFIHSNVLGGVSMNDCITKSVALSNQITMLYKNQTNQAK